MSFSSPSHPDDLSLSNLSFTITRGRVKDEKLEQSAREVQQWIETLIGEPVGKGGSGSGSESVSGSGVEELIEGLKSGVVLCKVANLVKPGVIASKKIKVPSPATAAAAAAAAAAVSAAASSSSLNAFGVKEPNAFGAMDNVAEFRNACKVIGVKEQVSWKLLSLLSFFLFFLLPSLRKLKCEGMCVCVCD